MLQTVYLDDSNDRIKRWYTAWLDRRRVACEEDEKGCEDGAKGEWLFVWLVGFVVVEVCQVDESVRESCGAAQEVEWFHRRLKGGRWPWSSFS